MDKGRMATIRQNLNHVISSHTDYPCDHIGDLEFLYTQVESLHQLVAEWRRLHKDAVNGFNTMRNERDAAREELKKWK